MSELINCGERNVQTLFRVALRDICERHGILIGDAVEVYIKLSDSKSRTPTKVSMRG